MPPVNETGGILALLENIDIDRIRLTKKPYEARQDTQAKPGRNQWLSYLAAPSWRSTSLPMRSEYSGFSMPASFRSMTSASPHSDSRR